MNKTNVIKHSMLLGPSRASARSEKPCAAQLKAHERFKGMFYTLVLVTVVTVLHELNFFS